MAVGAAARFRMIRPGGGARKLLRPLPFTSSASELNFLIFSSVQLTANDS